ncbi:MAG: transglutaminase [Deltaproteobacteria bacterium]|nr:transglutaminase [Deltaproteobacteria bacterium]
MRDRCTLVAASILVAAFAGAAPGQVVREIAAPGRTCTGLAWDGKLLWVADHGADELRGVDPQSGQIRRTLKSPGFRPAGLAWDGEQLWNVDVLEAKLYRIRPGDGVVTRTVPAPVKVPRALAWDGSALWLGDDDGRTIHRVDPSDGTTIREIGFPSKSADGLAWDGRYLWVADRLSDKLYALWPDSGEVIATLPAPGPHTSGLACDGQHLIGVDYQTDRVSWIKRDDQEHLIRRRPREEWVLFSHQLRNLGPDPLPTVELFLALPEDLITQELLGDPTLTPRPTEFRTDPWGQRVARFHVENVAAGATASAQLKAKLRAWDVRWVIYPDQVKPLSWIPVDVRKRYLADAPKFDLKNPIITAAVKEAVGSERNPYWIARKIYRHLHQKMHYERIGGWDVAPKVLARGAGSCSEYSYVYIALCRAAGLPARYVGSLVVRRDAASFDDVYHRWVEIYLPPYGWVPVDPSRGDKKTEAGRADSFGHVTNDFLITTHSGGGSPLLDWNYNASERYTCAGRCRVDVEGIAEWSPEDPGLPPPQPSAQPGPR